MTFTAYNTEHKSDTYDNAHKRVKALWTLARREFNIRQHYDVVLAAMNPTTMLRLREPYSHVMPRADRDPVVILRVSKPDMGHEGLLSHVLPREMAHVVCKINPTLGDPYHKDEGWQKVYKRLGGQG